MALFNSLFFIRNIIHIIIVVRRYDHPYNFLHLLWLIMNMLIWPLDNSLFCIFYIERIQHKRFDYIVRNLTSNPIIEIKSTQNYVINLRIKF